MIENTLSFDPKRQIAVIWDVEDVQSIRGDLTAEQAFAVLQHAHKGHDADMGINWDVLKSWAQNLFPENDKQKYVLSYRSYAGEDYFEIYDYKSVAIADMKDCAELERQNLEDEGYDWSVDTRHDGIEVYAVCGSIYHEWKLETLDEFCERIWVEMEDVPFTADDKLDEDYHIWEKGADKYHDIWPWLDKHHSKGAVYLVNDFDKWQAGY